MNNKDTLLGEILLRDPKHKQAIIKECSKLAKGKRISVPVYDDTFKYNYRVELWVSGTIEILYCKLTVKGDKGC